MVITLAISAILAIILGVLVLVFPRLLRWAIGLWLLISGVLSLINQAYPALSPY